MQPPAEWTHVPGGGTDLDCWIEGFDPQWPLRLPPGWRLLHALRYGISQWHWWLEGPDGIEIIDTTKAFDTGVATEAMMDRTEIEALPAVRAVYMSGKGLFKGTKKDEARWRRIADLAAHDPAFYRDALQTNFGARLGGRLAEAGLRGVPPDDELTASLAKLRKHLWIKHPVQRIAWRVLETKRVIARATSPTGLTVHVVGPDGSGKSTFVGRLMEATEPLFRRRQRVHWAPGVLPRSRRSGGEPGGEVTQPHGREPRSVPASYLALAYYWLDNLIGGWFVLGHVRRRTGLVVVERGWWDIAVDPRRYRMRVAPRIVRFLGAFLPSPDAIFVLDGPADLLASRKAELPEEEIDRQLSAWRDLAPKVSTTMRLDASYAVDTLVGEAKEWITQRLEARTAARVGAGWLSLPPWGRLRFLVPRGPGRASTTGLEIYQPMTRKGRIGWETGRSVAMARGFRLGPRGPAPAHEIREVLSKHIPRGGNVALQLTGPGRCVALVVDSNGKAHRLIKLSTEPDQALEKEAANLERFASRLVPPLLAPRLLDATSKALVFEPVQWIARERPWELPTEVAHAVGHFTGEGTEGERRVAHGDFAPWNLLKTRGGWVLIDWEEAGEGYPLMFDLFHYLVQAHCLLGRPTQRELQRAIYERRGRVGEAVSSFVSAVGADHVSLDTEFVDYLHYSSKRFDPKLADHKAAVEARDRLLAAHGARRR
jgi:hypothetical protein